MPNIQCTFVPISDVQLPSKTKRPKQTTIERLKSEIKSSGRQPLIAVNGVLLKSELPSYFAYQELRYYTLIILALDELSSTSISDFKKLLKSLFVLRHSLAQANDAYAKFAKSCCGVDMRALYQEAIDPTLQHPNFSFSVLPPEPLSQY